MHYVTYTAPDGTVVRERHLAAYLAATRVVALRKIGITAVRTKE